MELKTAIRHLLDNKKTIFLVMIAGILVGIVIHLLPPKYISTGSFYIKRGTDTNKNFFTYEGYYGQQTALSYTNTVAALLESTDLRSKALYALRIPINEFTLRRYEKLISVKKEGPQLITLAVKGSSFDASKNLWEALSNMLIETTKEINAQGDPNLNISRVSVEPVVKKEYKSIWINLTAGAGMGMMLGILFVSFREYLKNDKNNSKH